MSHLFFFLSLSLLLSSIVPYGSPYLFHGKLSFRRSMFHPLKASTSSSNTDNNNSDGLNEFNKKSGQFGKASSELVSSVSIKGNQVFDFSESRNILTSECFSLWEKQVDDVLGELTRFTRKDAVMSVYKSVLIKASAKALDPLQQATFEVFSNTLVDTLVKIHPEGAPITIVIDSLTNLHISFIDDFAQILNNKPSRYLFITRMLSLYELYYIQ